MGWTSRRPPGYLLKQTIRSAGLDNLSDNSPKLPGAGSTYFEIGRIEMEKDLTLDMMLTERWSNNACRGYVIWRWKTVTSSPRTLNGWS